MNAIPSSLEVLEARIAPAMATLQIVNPHTATYTDVDGDHVTVKISAGDLHNAIFTGTTNASHDQLQTLDLSAPSFDHTNLTFSVVKVAGGDGLANVGDINGGANDLGSVLVKGDLGQIDTGSGSATVPAIKSLSVHSMGRLSTDTQAGGSPNLQSDITGALGSLKVTGDVKEAFIDVFGAPTATLGPVTIGGSLIGGSGSSSGRIFSTGNMGLVKIGGNVQGGAGVDSGEIVSGSRLTGITIGGSLIGGSNNDTGRITANDLGMIRIGHDVQGGAGSNSGEINSTTTLGGITIGGSLIGGSNIKSGYISSGGEMSPVKIGHDVQGGAGSNSAVIDSTTKLDGVIIGGSLVGGANSATGYIVSGGDMGAVKIGGDVQGGAGGTSGEIRSNAKLAGMTIGGSVIGGSGDDSGEIFGLGDVGAVKIGGDLRGGGISGSTTTLTASGFVVSAHRIASVAIGGSIIVGFDNSAGGSLAENASVVAGNDIGSVTVTGSVIGSTGPGGDLTRAIISARGQATPTATADLAIGKITIGGRVEDANILAGYDAGGAAANGDAQIGAVKVGGDWVASNLLAGARNLGADDAANGTGANADDVNYGDTHDFSIGAGKMAIVSRIASITIKGQLFGTPDSTSATDHFGFVAQQIGKVRIGGNAIVFPVNTTPQAIGETDDASIHLIA